MINTDFDKAWRTVTNWVTKDITTRQHDILVKFVMDNGPDVFKRSSLLKKINRGDMKGAIKELPSLGEVEVNI
jgi:GH24 family phage-related lysozyme (muramidase)